MHINNKNKQTKNRRAMKDINAMKGEIKLQELKLGCSFNKNVQGRPFMCKLGLSVL